MTNMYKKTSTPSKSLGPVQNTSNELLMMIDRTGDRSYQNCFKNTVCNDSKTLGQMFTESSENKTDKTSDVVVVDDDDDSVLYEESVDLAQESDKQSRASSVVTDISQNKRKSKVHK